MKTTCGIPFAGTVFLLVLLCCIGLASAKPSTRNEGVTRSPEVEGQEATGGNLGARGVLNPKKPLSLTARLALLENSRRGGNGITKKPQTLDTKLRPKRNADYDALYPDGGGVPGEYDADMNPDEYGIIESVVFADWSECNVSCGIGYQTIVRPCNQPIGCGSEEGRHELRRCIGIDCRSPKELEAKLACSGSGGGGGAASLVIGLVVGVIITLATCGAVKGIMRFKSADKEGSTSSSSKTKKKVSSRPPMPVPRDGKTKDADEEHIYDEIDGQSNKKTKGSNSYVTMSKKETSKKKKGGKAKSKKKPKSEDSDHTYVDPDELNQPCSADEIQRLRDPPPPPGRKSKKDDGYEVPMQNDYMEIDE